MWDRRRPTATDLAALADVWLRMHAVEREGLWPSRGYERPLAEVWAHLNARVHAYIVWASAPSRGGGTRRIYALLFWKGAA